MCRKGRTAGKRQVSKTAQDKVSCEEEQDGSASSGKLRTAAKNRPGPVAAHNNAQLLQEPSLHEGGWLTFAGGNSPGNEREDGRSLARPRTCGLNHEGVEADALGGARFGSTKVLFLGSRIRSGCSKCTLPGLGKTFLPLRCHDGQIKCSRKAFEAWQVNICRAALGKTGVFRSLGEQKPRPLLFRLHARPLRPRTNEIAERIVSLIALPAGYTGRRVQGEPVQHTLALRAPQVRSGIGHAESLPQFRVEHGTPDNRGSRELFAPAGRIGKGGEGLLLCGKGSLRRKSPFRKEGIVAGQGLQDIGVICERGRAVCRVELLASLGTPAY